MIDASLDEGMTAAGISRHLEGIGATVSAEVIARHRKHYADDRPLAPKGTRKQDLAVIVRDKVLDKLDTEDGDAVEAMLFSKAGQGAIAVGLKAQNILDTREKMKAKTGQTLELLAGLRAILTGGIAPVALLEDPNVIEGEAVEVDGEAD
jgi:hypothetical protein